MLDFWQTVRGVQLAETLIHTLPQIADKSKQLMVEIKGVAEVEELATALKTGKCRYVDSLNIDGKTFVIIEK